MEVNLTIQILQEKLSEERNDTFWYSGDIACISLPSGNRIYAEATGQIAVQLDEDDVYLKGRQGVEEAIKRGLTDEDLSNLIDDDRFRNNNWIVILKVNGNGDLIGDDLAIADSYDHALEMIMECAKEEHKLEYNIK